MWYNESMSKNVRFKVIYQEESGGGYTAIVPSLPGCVTYGSTIKEAEKMVADAIDCYIESLTRHNEEIPVVRDVMLGTVETNLPHNYA